MSDARLHAQHELPELADRTLRVKQCLLEVYASAALFVIKVIKVDCDQSS